MDIPVSTLRPTGKPPVIPPYDQGPSNARVGLNDPHAFKQTAPRCRPPLRPRPRNWRAWRMVHDPDAPCQTPPTWHYSFVGA